MAKKENTNISYDSFTESLKTGQIGSLYFLHGEERYLLDHSLSELRQLLCPNGLDSFNYRRYEGRSIELDDLENAIDTLPAFAERTLIEIHDYDIFNSTKKESKGIDKQRLSEIFTDLPDYVCIAVVFNTIPYKPDGRVKLDKEILSHANVIDFPIQEQSKLLNWISRRFAALHKRISKADAQYLALITDGHMASLVGEIEKICAYSIGDAIMREDIDAVVTPVISAFAYKLTDALLENKHMTAMSVLDELFQMREPAQKIIFNISLKMRQFLAARICIENKMDRKALTTMCGIRYDFQARFLMDSARSTTLSKCRRAVILCSQAAYDLNSGSEPEARLVELIAQLAYLGD